MCNVTGTFATKVHCSAEAADPKGLGNSLLLKHNADDWQQTVHNSNGKGYSGDQEPLDQP